MNMTGFIDALAAKGGYVNAGDYRGEDGLLRCGKCHRQKEMRLDGFFGGRIVPIICKCVEDERERYAEEQRSLRIKQLRRNCIPQENMRIMCLKNADDSKPVQIARKYAENFEKYRDENIGLIFWGSCGTGKTFAAMCIANALIDREIGVWFCSCADLVSMLADRDRRFETLERVTRTPLLILDDLGAERETEYAREQLCRAIDARIDSGKPLVCTTNYSYEEMKTARERAQARIFDRVLGACIPIKVVGTSRRVSDAEKKLSEFRSLGSLTEGAVTK